MGDERFESPVDGNYATRIEDAVIDRLEIITPIGRIYTNYNVGEIRFLLQDGNRTLKIFIDTQEGQSL